MNSILRLLQESLFDNSIEGVLFGTTTGIVMRANPAACRMLGYSEAELIRIGRSGFVVNNSKLVDLLATRREHGSITAPLDFRKADGTTFPVEVTSVLVAGPSGEELACTTFRDITERNSAEQALRVSEARHRLLADNAMDVVWTMSLDGKITYVSPAVEKLRGFTVAEAMAQSIEEILTPASQAVSLVYWTKLFADIAAGRPPERFRGELEYRCKDGSTVWTDVITLPVVGPDGKVQELLGMSRDLTERKQAEKAALEREAALKESENRFRELYDSLPDGIVGSDPGGNIVGSNKAFQEMLGYTASELQGLSFPQITPDRWRQAELLDVLEHLRIRSAKWDFEKEYRRKDGTVFPVEIRSFIDYAGDRPGKMWAIVRDITGRKQTENALRASEGLLRAVTDSSPDAIFAKDREGRWTFANSAALRTVGKSSEEILGKTDEEILGDATVARELTAHDRKVMESGVGHAFEEKVPVSAEMRTYLTSKAALRDAEGRVVGIVGVAKDVTEMRRLEERLAVNARLAAMGTLVAGVAHEINNPLAAELSGQGLALEVARDTRKQLQEGTPVDLKSKLLEIDEVVHALEDAQEAGQRVAKIVRDLALFAHPTVTRTRICLRDAVEEGIRWLPRSMSAGADIEVDDRGAPEVMATGGQVAQVVSNLVSNALKATRPGTRGKVVVRLDAGNPGWAILEVIDQGVGIAPDLCPRVFDPFFTTRPAGEGRGSGLGLAVAHAIVTSHDGNITVESESGKGSTFRVELPAAPAEA